jgi:K+-transporting ATPase A subunit
VGKHIIENKLFQQLHILVMIYSFIPVWRESDTSTVALGIVGGNEKGNLESETVKYGQESHLTWTALATASSNCNQQTRPLIRESIPYINKPATL